MINKTGLTVEEYMEMSDGYSWFDANKEWTKLGPGVQASSLKKIQMGGNDGQDGRCLVCKNRAE